jgi:hypothetical protein
MPVVQRTRDSRRRALRQLTGLVAGPLVPLGRPAAAWTKDTPAAITAQASAPASGDGPASVDGPASAALAAAVLAAAWQEGNRHFVGVLAAAAGAVTPLCREEVPTRAHGIIVEPQGTLLVAARRPGDWLLRFDPHRRKVLDRYWSDGDYAFNGHVIRSADGRRLFTTETSLETGEGSVGVRDSTSLALLARWPTAGIDPHELILGPDGGLWVANGGIETRLETGRTKHQLDRMDSSLVRLDAAGGRLTGQWRLEDHRLGLRHLAVAGDGTLGIALQAEHDDVEARQSAPVLALWSRQRGLRAVRLPPGVALAGYGGSIAPLGDGIAVSCPRAGQLARWRLFAGEARWQAPLPLPQACALAGGWVGGAGAVVRAGRAAHGAVAPPVERWRLHAAIRLDNHWATMNPAALDPAALDPAALDPAAPDSAASDSAASDSAASDSAAPDPAAPDSAAKSTG